MAERLQPFEHTPPEGTWGWCRFQLRLLVDFQVRTVYHDLKGFLPQVKGRVLDLGCGLSPYKHLLNPASTEYIGLDIDTSSNFGYGEAKVVHFDGQHIPFTDGSIDCVMCTEVLEHVQNAKQLVDEMYRVLKPGSSAIITVPWSARVHYKPFDYYRFTPYVLEEMFREFSCAVSPRGTDITVIVSKVMILYLRNFLLSKNIMLGMLHLLLMLIFAPFIVLFVVIGHLSLICHWGSPDDPLGWTVLLKKKVL
jgi:SAM-dependent methyltransferase